jgi:Ca2+-binding RTX toxin-like protein
MSDTKTGKSYIVECQDSGDKDKNTLDGIVEGTSGDDLIDLGYTGDPEGDMVDHQDAIQPGFDQDSDIIDAGAGDDTVQAGLTDDTVFAGSGSDLVYGEAGDDVLYGDSNVPPSGRESFEWDKAPDPNGTGGIDNGDTLTGGFSQDTGSVVVDFSVLPNSEGSSTYTEKTLATDGIVTDGDPVDTTSGLRSVLDSAGGNSAYKLDFSDAVENVSFRINDIDRDSSVIVQAYDADGNAVAVNLTPGANLTLQDTDSVAGNDTADSGGANGSYDDLDNSVLVDIAGPISRIFIIHSQDGDDASGIAVTDIYFDAAYVVDPGVPGDDTLIGGEGDDVLYGQYGDDSLIGGDGSDTVKGGDGDDIIDTSGGTPLPDLGFPGYGIIPPIPADGDIFDDRDVVYGGAGNDDITTGDDADWIDGGTGHDTIDGGLDQDTIEGGDGNDVIVGGEGSDEISGGTGDDLIYGGLDPSFPDSLNIVDDGSAGAPDPVTNNGMDVIDGGEGNDTIYGQDDADIIEGGSGDDRLYGGIDNDLVHGGSDNDLVSGGQGVDTVYGDAGNDLVLGGAGADELYGGDGADVLGITIGDTVVEGGEGGPVDFDTMIAQGLATIEWDGGDPSSESGTVTFYDSDLNPIGTVDYSEIERGLILNTGGSDVTATPAPTAGVAFTENVVEGTDSDDFIDVAYTDDPEGDMIDNGDARPPLSNNEDVVVAGAGDDFVLGGLESDAIFGQTGDDTLFGEGGNDAIGGGDGDDVLIGGEGRDIVAGGAGDDTISGDSALTGDGGDLLFGNTGDDSFINIGQGETIDGGEDADDEDVDVLNLEGAAEIANAGGSLSVAYDPSNAENGVVTFYDALGNITGTTAFENIERVVCFTLGTLIATPKGERKIEDLKIGDRVITRDNGIQEIRWMGRKSLTGAHVKAARHLRPVLIQQGALGNGLPERDMMVSPNHRVLVANDKTALYFEDREVLVAAKYLTGLEGVDVVDVSNVTYIHFMFDQHEVVLSDGAWTESFQPGDHSLEGIGNSQRNEIFELFPELENAEGLKSYQSARRSLKKHEAQLLSR